MANNIYADQIRVEQAVLVIAVPDKEAQVLTLELEDLNTYEQKWIRKVSKFHKLMDAA
jgi:hypothetical protein